MSKPNELPESVLKLIIREMVKEDFDPRAMDSIYEDVSDLHRIESILKKFGIIVGDISEFGFYAMLLMNNFDVETNEILSPLVIPKLFKVNVNFNVELKKRIEEIWVLPLDTYNLNESFINDMMSAGDMSYHDGEFYDDEVMDTDFIDWNITSIQERRIQESKKTKKLLKENKNLEIVRLQKLQRQIQKRINELI